MIVEEGLDALRHVPAGSVMSVGNFDGVHLGHQHILASARAQRTPGHELVIVTFEPHPLTVLKPELAPPRLISLDTKRRLLAQSGVDRLILLPPSQDVLNTTAEAFFAILRDETRVAHLVEGPDFNFGKGRGGTIDKLRDWCARDCIQLTTIDDVTVTLSDLSIVPVSSSLIRWLIAYGRVADAAICLGRPYTIEGVVVHGEKRGRSIGFPTANLAIDKPLLADGVYAARTIIDEKPFAVALSVGTKPTFDGVGVTVEGFLLDYSGDLYGRSLTLELITWVREQRKYPSLKMLIDELHRDVEIVRGQVKDATKSV